MKRINHNLHVEKSGFVVNYLNCVLGASSDGKVIDLLEDPIYGIVEINPNNASPFMIENVTLIYLSTTFFLSDVAIEDTLKMQAICRFFFVYLTSRASNTLKVQTDYLTFGNLITTSDTPKVQSSKAIAVEEYLLKLYAAIIIV